MAKFYPEIRQLGPAKFLVRRKLSPLRYAVHLFPVLREMRDVILCRKILVRGVVYARTNAPVRTHPYARTHAPGQPHTHIHTCIDAHTHSLTHAHTHAHAHTCNHAYTYRHARTQACTATRNIHAHTHKQTYTHMHMHMHTHTHACMHARMYVLYIFIIYHRVSILLGIWEL